MSVAATIQSGMMSDQRLEARTREIGRRIFARVREERPGVGSAGWWDEKMMGVTMRDEGVKIQLFRFVDALPALRTPRQITRHLKEYFAQVEERLPAVALPILRWLPENGWVGRSVARAAQFNVRRLAKRFIAGSDLPQTLEAIAELRRRSLAFTIDLLGEAVLSESEAERYQGQYLHFLEGLTREANDWPENRLIDRDHGEPIPRVNVSIKLSSLYSQFDPIDPERASGAVRERLRPILRLAQKRWGFVNIDMESDALKDLTLRIFKEVFDEPEFRDWANVGIAIQAYLRSCRSDLEDLAAWTRKRPAPVWVRLVKGAYWDYETIVAAQQGWPVPVWTEKGETDANFESCTEFLVENREVLRPAIASHNVRSIARALALFEKYEVPARMGEFQMLYGMAEPIKSALIELEQRVRVYTPFGEILPGMAYLVRRLLENTSNSSFLRAGFLEHVPEEKLLMNPMDLITHRRTKKVVETDRKREFRNEPLADFSVEENRERMREAIEEVGKKLGEMHPLVIGGKKVSTAKTIESVNPSHFKQIVGRTASATVEDAKNAIGAAAAAFPGWRDTAVAKRAEVLFRMAGIMRRRRFELTAWEIFECGKQWREADADVAEAIDYCDYYAMQMLKLAEPRMRNLPGEENVNFYEPRGVCVTIAPWNFPLAILCGMTMAAVVSGNTAVMKPAEQSVIIGAKLMEVITEAGCADGVVNFLPGVGEEIGPVLVSDPRVAMIAFTGSKAVGLGINEAAARTAEGQDHVKRVVVEMGGKNAIIVDEDADLDEAVAGVAGSAFGYAGQKCSACSRVIVMESIYEQFLKRLIEVSKSLRIGPAEEAGAFVGPVIDGEARERILRMIEKGKGEGKVIFSGEVGALAGEGFFVPPTIFGEVKENATIAQEEVFGPVLAAIKARDLGDALRIANGTKYALTGGVYSRSPESIERCKREFRAGNLYINRKITGALVERQPFGGFKLSGIGSQAGGVDYLQQFMVPRTVSENTLRHGFAPVDPMEHMGEPAGE
ncbi:MAG TPA: L-glutamate gamma-semialdehyde dehydrogenase [Tepidisphaeraceae bacterium]|nr:L-glutamate gamma-semialdehyde dehydrogenase [Tepidisphaeraceae bacterium]